MKTRSLIALVAAFSVLVSPAAVPARADDAELAEGIRQAQQGEFDSAAVTLDRVARRLAAAKAPGAETARAYVYLAVAQIGLAQEGKAKASFLEARRQHPPLRLDAKEFPPRIVQAYETALREAGLSVPGPAPSAPPPAAEKKGGSKALWVVLGGAAVAGGAALALGGGDDPPPSTVPPPVNVAGRWVGDGANGELLVSGDCSIQNSVVLNITQSGGAVTGTADFVVLRAPCSPTTVGNAETLQLSGTIDAQGQISFRFLNGRIPTEVWSGTVDGNRTRMSGDVTGIPGISSGRWAVVR